MVAVIGAIFLSKYVFKERLASYPNSFVNSASYLFAKAENFGGFAGKIKNFNHLASENDKLKQDNMAMLSLRAKVDDLENENEFLRHAARVSQKLDYAVVYAGVFNLNLTSTGYNVLINKGIQDGISEGDIVITAEGVLVGKIDKVMPNFSRVLFVTDPEFKITAKVMSSGTSGIGRGALNEGMYLDFVSQEDEIKEEDLLISTGSDHFPPALIVGSVEHVEVNLSEVFKKVRIRPAVKGVKLSKVLVVKMK